MKKLLLPALIASLALLLSGCLNLLAKSNQSASVSEIAQTALPGREETEVSVDFSSITCHWGSDGVLEQADLPDSSDGSTLVSYYYLPDGTPNRIVVTQNGTVVLRLFYENSRLTSWAGSDGSLQQNDRADSAGYYNQALRIYEQVCRPKDPAAAAVTIPGGADAGAAEPPREPVAGGTYRLPYGSGFTVPSGFVLLEEDEHHWRLWNEALQMEIDISESLCTGASRELLQNEYRAYEADSTVVYLATGDDWNVASGYWASGDLVYYLRTGYLQDRYAYRYQITYPTEYKTVCDDITGEFAHNYQVQAP